MTRRLMSLVAIAMVVSACDGTGFGVTTSSAAVTGTSPVPSSTLPPIVECPGSGEFEEGGGIADVDEAEPDGSRLGRISWETSDQCETFQFTFETSQGAPATAVPDIRVDHLESFQVIRISMDIDASALTDQLVETPLVDRFYVVAATEGGMFVDLHLNSPTAARARVTSSPATLAIDLKPGLVEFVGTSSVHEAIVVVSPPTDATVDTAAQVVGYTRSPGADIEVVATQDDQVVFSTSVTSSGTDDGWTEFRTDLVLPIGQNRVFVGQTTADDETPDGVTFDLVVS